jgi:hypothetical protein
LVFQRSAADFSCIADQIRSSKEFLSRQIDKPGPYSLQLDKWLARAELQLDSGRSMRNSPNLESHRRQWLALLRDNLDSRFPSVALFEAFATLFEQSKFPKIIIAVDENTDDEHIDFGDFGFAALTGVLDLFGVEKTNSDGTKFAPLVNAERCKEEWLSVRRYIAVVLPKILDRKKHERKQKKKLKGLQQAVVVEDENDVFEDIDKPIDVSRDDEPVRVTMADLLQHFLSDQSICSVNTQFVRLMCIALTIPVVTADCERGFSVMNSIKSESRNRLLSVHLDRLMRITIEGQSLVDFPSSAAAQRWHSRQRRRIPFVSPTAQLVVHGRLFMFCRCVIV